MATATPALNPKADEIPFISAENKYTNIPLLPSLLVALIGGSLSIALAYLLKDVLPYLYALILERGSIQFLTLYAFWFAVGLLIFKYRNLQRERAAFGLDFIRSFTAGREVVGTQTILSQHRLLEENLDPAQKDLILVNRLNKAIKQIRINTNPADVAHVLATVADTDAAIIDSSYILLKYMIWIIPVLGFIGTVMGMTQAIGSFDVVIRQISDLGFAGVQQNLGLVTGGLAVAFDTTFLALVLSAVANLFTNSLQKKEEDLLSDVEEFTTDNIINKYSSLKSAVAPLAQLAPPGRFDAEEAAQGLLRELKNMNRQQQVNAEALQAQLGRAIEALQGLSQAAPQPAESADTARLETVLQEVGQVLKDQAEFIRQIELISAHIERNVEVLEKLPRALDEINATSHQLGELFGRIYNRTFQ